MSRHLPVGAVCAGLVVVLAGTARASDRTTCGGALTIENALNCGLSASPELRRARASLDVARGHVTTASPALPSLPTVDLLAAGRAGETDSAFDAYLNVRQELDVTGQRDARVQVAEIALEAARRRVEATTHEVSAEVARAYIDVLASRRELALLETLAPLADALEGYARQRVEAGLLGSAQGTVLRSEAAHTRAAILEARRVETHARHVFTTLLADEAADVGDAAGSLLDVPEQPKEAFVTRAFEVRGDVVAARAEADTRRALVQLLERVRLPNPSILLTAQRDGFRELVLGGGVAWNVPLPGDLGPSRAGEIESARAQVMVAEAGIEAVQRLIRLEVEDAVEDLKARRTAFAAFPDPLADDARRDLAALATELEQGRLAFDVALLTRRSLVEFLGARLRAQRALDAALVELRHAAGLPWPGESK